MPGSRTWAASRAAWTPATRLPDLTHLLRLDGIPAQEGVLAADAAQHAQPGDGVGAEADEPAGLLALVGLALPGAGGR